MADEDENGFATSPRPNAIELERTIASLRTVMSPEAAKETETVLRRMFERAMRWHLPSAGQSKAAE
jgi:hypothetical protein